MTNAEYRTSNPQFRMLRRGHHTTKRKTSSRKARRNRPRIFPASEQMKIYSATLMQELQTWSHVKTRPMFGFISFYRNRKIFAAIPKTRAWQSPHSLMFRLPSVDTVLRKKIEADPRIDTEESGLWFPFEVRSERDINGALEWLSIAYEQAGS